MCDLVVAAPKLSQLLFIKVTGSQGQSFFFRRIALAATDEACSEPLSDSTKGGAIGKRHQGHFNLESLFGGHAKLQGHQRVHPKLAQRPVVLHLFIRKAQNPRDLFCQKPRDQFGSSLKIHALDHLPEVDLLFGLGASAAGFRHDFAKSALRENGKFAARGAPIDAGIDRAGGGYIRRAFLQDLLETLECFARAQGLASEATRERFTDFSVTCKITRVTDGAPSNGQPWQPLRAPLAGKGLQIGIGGHVVRLTRISDRR